MLAEHRVDDADECLVAVEESVSSGQEIPFQPTLALVFAQHGIQNAAIWREELVVADFAVIPLAIGDLEDRLQEIRDCFIRAEDTEVALVLIQSGDIAQERAQHERVLNLHGTRRSHFDCVVMEIRHAQVVKKNTAVRMWISAHAAGALRGQLSQFLDESSILVE
jgi:hypothetical protein